MNIAEGKYSNHILRKLWYVSNSKIKKKYKIRILEMITKYKNNKNI